MRRMHGSLVFGFVVALSAANVMGQTPRPAPDAQTVSLVPLQLQIVIVRTQGDKRISSLPYTLSLTANASVTGQAFSPTGIVRTGGSSARIRVNAQVPTPTTVFTPAADGKPATTVESFNYRDVGTSIDVSSIQSTEGHYGFELAISDSSVYEADESLRPKTVNAPVIRTFQVTNSVHLKDGETTQFTAATDRITGEVVRVEVTLKVLR